MFINYPDEYSIPVIYSEELFNNKERKEENNTEILKEKILLRDIGPFQKEVECEQNDSSKINHEEIKSIFNKADEEYINYELKTNI